MLKAAIDELARRFATTSAGGTGRQRLRERTDDLVLDLLAVLKTASLGEIAETTRALERRRKTRVLARSTSPASTSQSGSSRRGQALGEAEEQRARADEKAPATTRNPFDITVPSELLEPAKTSGGALRDAPRTPRKQTLDLMGLSAAAAPSTPLEPPPHRSVSLREGEQLLRTGGAGAIIRRVRGS